MTESHPLRGKLPPRRLAKEELARTHKSHLKKQDLTPDAPRPVKQPLLDQAYPASTRSIRDLEIVPLSDLRIEEHHRGKGVVVKVISPPYVGAGVISLVEDELGNADKIAIYNHSDSSILSGVPEGCIVAVKEPYYKYNGSGEDYMICVDHPSDVILLRFTDPIIPELLRLGPLLKSAVDWRSAGDKAFIERDFPTAVFWQVLPVWSRSYLSNKQCQALEASDDGTFRAGIFAKRAGTNLVLGRYDAAKADALASRTGASSDWKAYFTAGRACYGLCDYQTSRGYLESALGLDPPATSSVKKEHSRCLSRLYEESTGSYNFEALFDSLSPTNVHLDVASFLSNTRVADSPLHGRGLFAARNIKAGELIYVEKATLMPNQYEPSRASAALYAMMVRQLYDNPSLASTILSLYGGAYQRSGHEGDLVDGVPIVDIFLVESIRNKNCFSAPLSTLDDTRPTTTSGRMAKGLWLHASYMNHSCVPNSMRSFLGDLLISRATRNIAEGEELSQQYVPVKALSDVRQAQFLAGWGFTCQCALCEAESRGSRQMLQKRKEILGRIERVCGKNTPNKGVLPDSAIRTVDRLTKQLEELHETEVYAGLPRLALVYPVNWLIQAHRGRKAHAKVVRYALRLLREFGFRAPADEDANWEPREIYNGKGGASLMTIHVVTALKYASEAYKALGRTDLAARCEEAGRFGYMMVTGFENDLGILNG
ncbi:SET domain-containing protein [Coniochaeta ligniaria NRRL 30616]|uniref:SET domain-containing protein n=1 Tax=Coniochaeta ligniaria NRRL 30616 TaxID=1408157 RepID=A0A1J7I8G1_9PEZI|nr:SET domain-containing protein [Coniochaeta ligniaria NRRL 30616]